MRTEEYPEKSSESSTCFVETITAYWLSVPSCCVDVDGVEERVGVVNRSLAASRDSSRQGSDGAPITAPVPSMNDTHSSEPFSRNILPLGETMTGWVRRGSPGAAKLMRITSTDPWLVPTHKDADTAVSATKNVTEMTAWKTLGHKPVSGAPRTQFPRQGVSESQRGDSFDSGLQTRRAGTPRAGEGAVRLVCYKITTDKKTQAIRSTTRNCNQARNEKRGRKQTERDSD